MTFFNIIFFDSASSLRTNLTLAVSSVVHNCHCRQPFTRDCLHCGIRLKPGRSALGLVTNYKVVIVPVCACKWDQMLVYGQHAAYPSHPGSRCHFTLLTPPSLTWWNLKMPHNRFKSDRFHSSGVRPNGMDGKFLFMYNDMEEQGIEPHSRACKIRLKSGQTT